LIIDVEVAHGQGYRGVRIIGVNIEGLRQGRPEGGRRRLVLRVVQGQAHVRLVQVGPGQVGFAVAVEISDREGDRVGKVHRRVRVVGEAERGGEGGGVRANRRRVQ